MKQIFYNLKLFENNQLQDYILIVENNKFTEILEDNEVNKKHLEQLKKNHENNLIDLQGNTVLPAFININADFLNYVFMHFSCDVHKIKQVDKLKQKIKDFSSSLQLDNNDYLYIIGLEPEMEKLNIINKQWLDELDLKTNLIINLGYQEKICVDSKTKKYLESLSKEVVIDNEGYINKQDINLAMSYIPHKNKEQFLKIVNYCEQQLLKQGIVCSASAVSKIDDLILFTEMNRCHELLIKHLFYLDYSQFKNYSDLEFFKQQNSIDSNLNINGWYFVIDNNLVATEADYSDKKADLIKLLKNIIDTNNQLYLVANNENSIQFLIDVIKNHEFGIDLLKQHLIIESNMINQDAILQLKQFVNHIVNCSGIIWNYHSYLKSKYNTINWNDLLVLNHSLIKNNFNLITSQNLVMLDTNLFQSLWSMTNRKNQNYELVNENQIINVDEAIKTININPARLIQDEAFKAKILNHQYANFIVINKDINITQNKYLNSCKIVKTYYQSKLVYERNIKH